MYIIYIFFILKNSGVYIYLFIYYIYLIEENKIARNCAVQKTTIATISHYFIAVAKKKKNCESESVAVRGVPGRGDTGAAEPQHGGLQGTRLSILHRSFRYTVNQSISFMVLLQTTTTKF